MLFISWGQISLPAKNIHKANGGQEQA